MAYTTFSQTKNDQLKEPMFFGQPVNVARYDQQKYDIFEKLIEKQLSFFWRPEEVDVPYRLPGAAGARKTHLYQQPEISDAAGFHSGS